MPANSASGRPTKHWLTFLRYGPMTLLLLAAVAFSIVNHLRSVDFAAQLRQLRDLERSSSALFFAGVEFKEAALNLLLDTSGSSALHERYSLAHTNLHSQMLVADARTEQSGDPHLLRKLQLLMDEIDNLHQRIIEADTPTDDRQQHIRILGFLVQRWLLQVEAVNAAIRLKTIQSDAALETLQRTSLMVFAYVLMIALSLMTWMLNRWSKQQKAQQDREAFLHRMAEIDPLTGLLNRRGWDRVSRVYENNPVEIARGLTLIMIDLDHFKRFNDREGHAAGDHLLARFAQLLQAKCRPNDDLVRLGGEEFLLALPQCNAVAADQLLTRLREGNSLPISFSAGIAEMKVGERIADALNRADRALYRAKHLGRARTCLAQSPTANNPPHAGASNLNGTDQTDEPGKLQGVGDASGLSGQRANHDAAASATHTAYFSNPSGFQRH